LFEESEIRSVGDTMSATSGGYVVQARTVAKADKGFVFLNSTLTHGVGPAGGDVPMGTTYLARSSGLPDAWDNVAYINCKMDSHVIPVGWAYLANNNPASNPATSSAAGGWREFGTTDLSGAALDPSMRSGGYTLTQAEFDTGFSNRALIFAAFTGSGGPGWNPQP
jgi:hypothetical protein